MILILINGVVLVAVSCGGDDDDDDDDTVDDDDAMDDDDSDDDMADDDDDDSIGPEIQWISIPAGSFEMGCSAGDELCDLDEKPRHPVNISAFEITQTEITQHQYNQTKDGCDDCPAVNIDYATAAAFCESLGGRLPTEGEWEYAARGGTAWPFYCDEGVEEDCLETIAWYYDNADQALHPVGKKEPNDFGLYDSIGNAWEWVSDWYEEEYFVEIPDGGWKDPQGPETGEYRVLRGGSYQFQNDAADFGELIIRVSYRYETDPTFSAEDVGFRCVRN
jgi:formylglycine-generating enzyme required for sulfatase activity